MTRINICKWQMHKKRKIELRRESEREGIGA
jgi:hypothetical protein